MEQIGKAIDKLALDPHLPQTTSAGVQKWLKNSLTHAKQEASNRDEILELVGEVEFAKQIRISDEERAVLCDRLFQLKEPIAKIRERAKAVERNTTYKSLAFEYWINTEQLYTAAEVERMVTDRIEQRRRQLEKINIPVAELEKAGLVEFSTLYARRYALAMEPVIAKLKTRCRRVQAFIRQAPEEVKLEIKAIAEEKGYIKDDPYWRMSLPFAAPHLLNEVEKIMKRVPCGKDHKASEVCQ